MIDLSIYLMAVESDKKKDKLEIIYTEYLTVMTHTAIDYVGKYHAEEDVVHNAIIKIISYLDRINLSNIMFEYSVIMLRMIIYAEKSAKMLLLVEKKVVKSLYLK